MARRKSTPSRSSSTRPLKAGAVSSADRVRARRQERGATHLSAKTWVIFYVVTFLIIETVIVFAFVGTGGDSRVRRQVLLEAEEYHGKGEYDRAIETLEDFGRRWPGAWGTENFNQRIGEYYYQGGDFEKSAAALKRAVEKDPSKWDVRALAGRSLWKLDQRGEAVEFFQQELKDANKNNDIAHYHLGRWALDKDTPIEAFEHFQAISDPAPWAGELQKITEQYRKELLEPARKEAEARAAELLP